MTWKSPANGQSARCDCLLVPLEWGIGDLRTYPLPTLDSGISGEDHVPLGGDFRVFVQTHSRKVNAQGFDRQAMQKDSGASLSRVFALPPCIDWTIDVECRCPCGQIDAMGAGSIETAVKLQLLLWAASCEVK